ncbi:hypothetical protein LTR28_013222 [Elasticomyces elasticus]|nr:hypothetical protein LTR28_013222 [Elasticomyces elasticus]
MELAKSGKELDVCAASFQNFPADPVVDPAKGIPYPGGVFVMKSLVDGHAACVYDGSADAAGRFSCPGLDGGRPVNCFQDPLDALGTNYTCAPIGILGDVRPVIFPKIFCQWGAARASSVVVTAEIPLPPTDGVELPSVTPPPASSSNSCELPWDSSVVIVRGYMATNCDCGSHAPDPSRLCGTCVCPNQVTAHELITRSTPKAAFAVVTRTSVPLL